MILNVFFSTPHRLLYGLRPVHLNVVSLDTSCVMYSTISDLIALTLISIERIAAVADPGTHAFKNPQESILNFTVWAVTPSGTSAR